jgi:hypothetical protein
VQELFEAIAPHMLGDVLQRGFDDQPLPAAAWEHAPAMVAGGEPHRITLLPPAEKALGMVGEAGIEPATSCLSSKRSTTELHAHPETTVLTLRDVETPPTWKLRGTENHQFQWNQALTTLKINHVKVTMERFFDEKKR